MDEVTRRRAGEANKRGQLATLTGPFILRDGLAQSGAISLVDAFTIVKADWERQVAEGVISDGVIKTYLHTLSFFLGVAARLGVTLLGDVTPNVVLAWLQMPGKAGLSPARNVMWQRRSAMRSFLETCRVLGLVEHNAAHSVELPGRSTRYVRPYSDVEMGQLQRVSRSELGDLRTPAVLALVMCGASTKELINVTVADVDVANGRVWLCGGGYRQRDRWVTFLTDWTTEAITQRVTELRTTYGADADAVSLVYKPHPSQPTPTRQATAGNTVLLRLQKKARLHVPGVTRTESIREWTAATIYAETGSLIEVARRLGMASLDAAAHIVEYDWTSDIDTTPPPHRVATPEAGEQA
ncbi:site-specific integrase [Nocardioides malaquae]|uniref:site-specific integrase n=1 Tax=Nocardioides malaquae TaxID=2773426 RepID=UPI00187AFEFB|nr:site-specific integrase [Nocardioides malaquae]